MLIAGLPFWPCLTLVVLAIVGLDAIMLGPGRHAIRPLALAAAGSVVAFPAFLFTSVVVVVFGRFDPFPPSALAESARGTSGPPLLIDPESRRAGPFRLGDRPEKLDRAFGPRLPTDEGDDTDWWKLGTLGTYPNPPGCRGTTHQAAPSPVQVTYRGVLATSCARGTFLISVTSRGSRTVAGAAIGESLRAAAAHHPGLRCETSTANTTDPPSPVYRYCSGRITQGAYLWLGQDPVSSIAIATVPLR